MLKERGVRPRLWLLLLLGGLLTLHPMVYVLQSSLPTRGTRCTRPANVDAHVRTS